MVRLFSHWFPSNTLLQVLFDAVFLVGCVLLAALWLHPGGIEQLEPALPPALLFAVIMAGLNTALGLYQRSACRTVMQTAARVLLSLLFAIPVTFTVFKLLPLVGLQQQTLNVLVLGALGALVALRGFATHRGASPMFVRRVLVFGTGAEALRVESSLKLFGPGMSIIGFFPSAGNDQDSQVPPERVVRSDMSLLDTAFRHDVDDLIVAVRERRGGVLPLKELLECKLRGVRVLDLSSFYERALGQVRLESLHASWLIFGDGFRQGFVRTLVKRCFDIVSAALLLVVASPVMLVTAIAIVAESGFPVLYRQERVGQAGRLFRVIKFRSMRTDAEVDGRPRWAVKNDSRTTKVGKLIRKLRVDELPQLINVLKGDMSLVGPRPERPHFVDQLAREIPFYAARHSVKPGVTGWAQVRYHYGSTVDDAVEKLQYDLYYVKNHTLFLDIVVLFETVGVVLTGKGAQ